MKKKLTKTVVESTKAAPGKRVAIWDLELPGFGCIVQGTGTKTYVYNYTDKFGDLRRLKIGRHGVLTCEEARVEASKASKAVTLGEDPQAEKKALQGAPTMADLETDFMKNYAEEENSEGTLENYRGYWKNHIHPSIGEKTRVMAVTEDHIRELKRAPSLLNKKVTFNRCRSLLSKAFNYCETRKENGEPAPWRPKKSNPCSDVKKNREKGRTRRLIRKVDEQGKVLIDEFARFGEAMDEMEAFSDVGWMQGKLRRALHCVPCRLDDLRLAEKKPRKGALRWIDWDRGILVLLTAKGGETETLITKAGMVILREVLEKSDKFNPYLFSGSKAGTSIAASCGIWQVVRVKYGLGDYRTHDARRTMGITGRNIGATVRDDWTAAFDHKSGDTTEVYLGADEDPLRAKLDLVADEVTKRIKGAA